MSLSSFGSFMAKKGKLPEIVVKKSAVEVRAEIKDFIRTRHSIGQKWKCLEQSVKSEDMRREQFYTRKLRESSRVLPLTIQKFIRTLKRAVRLKMRRMGGTPFSIVRQMFLYWDSAKIGALSSQDLDRCMKSLGVILTEEERNFIVNFYSELGGTKDLMHYHDLLDDIQRGEPSMLDFVEDNLEEENAELRFKTQEENYLVIPPLIMKFIEALRSILSDKLRVDGGTPYSHLRNAFLKYDSHHMAALSAEDLMRAMHMEMGLWISKDQCDEIVHYYDRRGLGSVDYKLLLRDVCTGMPDALTHKELTYDDIAGSKQSLSVNPFLPRPFKAAANVVVERFKKTAKTALESKVCLHGGSIKSWMKEAFTMWDKEHLGKVSRWQDLVGAMKRIGVNLTREEADALMRAYDKDGKGDIEYHYIIDDMVVDEPDLVSSTRRNANDSIGEPPAVVKGILTRLKRSVMIYPKESRGSVDPRDIIIGSFMRFDSANTGRVNVSAVKEVLKLFRVRVADTDIAALVTWCDTNGKNMLDYYELGKQLFGHCEALSKLNPEAYAAPPPRVSVDSYHDHIVLSDDPNAGEEKKISQNAFIAATMAPSSSDTKLVREARRALKTKQILAVKIKLENKLAQIEQERKGILDAYRSKKASNEAHDI